VLHTGDWKLDAHPVLGPPTDEAKLRALGEAGCLALMGDSTNAIRAGRSPSERDVAKTIGELIASSPARVAVTTFASHVGRIRSIAEAAHVCGREVVIIGRAMERIAQVAHETGYLKGIRPFRSAESFGRLPRERVVALCTGSQGEPRSALARIAEENHPDVSLDKGDRVIFSSRTIPGNEKAVNRVINGLVDQGVEVITDRTHLVHVSGHPRRDEMKDMLSWVRPRIVVPVHGEALHLAEHASLARESGVGETILCRNGDLVRLAPEPAGIIDEVPQGRLYKDGALIVQGEGRTVADRRRLAYVGVVSVALALDDAGMVAAEPEVELIGIPEADGAGRPFVDIVTETAAATVETLPRPRRRDPDTVAEAVRRAVRARVAVGWGKKPLCIVHVLTVD
jgi:ribonuclease J